MANSNNTHSSHASDLGPADTKLSEAEFMQRVQTAGAVSISPELFEKLYLTPKTPVKGELRRTFGNPTPLALIGFLLCLSPLSCDLMGWRGAGGNGAASLGSFWFIGGILMLIGGIFELILGNTFPAVVFSVYGAFWWAFAATLSPNFAAFSNYAPPGASSGAAGLETEGFNASFGFFTLFMGVMSFVFLVCSVRTNVCFVIIFFTLVLAFGLLTGAYWAMAKDFVGNAAFASRLTVGAGASAFVTSLSGWWIFFAIMLESLDFPFQIPIGDLSTIVRGRAKQTSEV